MTSQLLVLEETGVPGENHRLPPSHWQLSHVLRSGFEPGSGEGQRAVNGPGPSFIVKI